MSRLLVSVLFLLLLPAGLVEARKAPLAIPEPIPVPATLAMDQVVRAIKLAMTARTWLIEDEAEGRIEGRVNVRAHSARIAIEYDAREIRIRHIDSSNLEERTGRGGTRLIHRNYNSWLSLLAQEIRLKLQEASI
ncbi:MAG: hypothetical protein U0S76_02920 [Pseudoxanthomonas sp.]|nr:hypothetical protein [Pseudoxanthomonas sp.]